MRVIAIILISLDLVGHFRRGFLLHCCRFLADCSCDDSAFLLLLLVVYFLVLIGISAAMVGVHPSDPKREAFVGHGSFGDDVGIVVSFYWY